MLQKVHPSDVRQYRSIFISDVHLGFKGCQADLLLDFLHHTRCEYLYLVGDIIDVWNMKKSLYWPQSHNNVIRTILGKAKHDTKVIFVPGNHDEVFRDYAGMVFGNLSIERDCIHTTADGRRLLVLHGDEFDGVVKCSRWLAILGSRAYELLLKLNRLVDFFRKKLGFPYWSLAGFLKQKVKNAVNFISNFEQALSEAAVKRGADGIVAGHIHRAEITDMHGSLYCNDGDWVESCTALVENGDGSLELVYWAAEVNARNTVVQVAPAPERAA